MFKSKHNMIDADPSSKMIKVLTQVGFFQMREEEEDLEDQEQE